jgi:hypothetical protein
MSTQRSSGTMRASCFLGGGEFHIAVNQRPERGKQHRAGAAAQGNVRPGKPAAARGTPGAAPLAVTLPATPVTFHTAVTLFLLKGPSPHTVVEIKDNIRALRTQC